MGCFKFLKSRKLHFGVAYCVASLASSFATDSASDLGVLEYEFTESLISIRTIVYQRLLVVIHNGSIQGERHLAVILLMEALRRSNV